MLSIAYLLASFTSAMTMSQVAQAANSISQRCNLAQDGHCLYTPVKFDRINDTAPSMNMKAGGIAATDVDGAGAYTYLVTDNARGTLTVICRDGGQQFVDFTFGHTSSTIHYGSDSTGKGTVSFNDGSGTAIVGQSITSKTVGVDATVHCG